MVSFDRMTGQNESKVVADLSNNKIGSCLNFRDCSGVEFFADCSGVKYFVKNDKTFY